MAIRLSCKGSRAEPRGHLPRPLWCRLWAYFKRAEGQRPLDKRAVVEIKARLLPVALWLAYERMYVRVMCVRRLSGFAQLEIACLPTYFLPQPPCLSLLAATLLRCCELGGGDAFLFLCPSRAFSWYQVHLVPTVVLF